MAEQKPSRSNQQLHIDKVVHGTRGYDVHTRAISFPIYQSNAFRHPGLADHPGQEIHREQSTGDGAVLRFCTTTSRQAR